jgi:Tol biopolymer transport system component
MSEYRTALEQTRERFPAPELPLERVLRRRDRRRRNQRLAAGAVGLAIALAAILIGTSVIRSDVERPAHLTPPQIHNGLIALPGGDTLTLLDPQTGTRSELSLRTGRGGYTVSGFAWSPDGTKFAYATFQQGTVRVFDLKTDTISTIVPCGAPPPYRVGCMFYLAWSPDGSRIALSGSGGLDLIDPDGSNRTTLIDSRGARGNVGPPTWSPDGATIAFTARLPASSDHLAVYEVDADGSNLKVLFEQPGISPSSLRWSPDGSRIAYLVSVYPHPNLATSLSIEQVWIVNADGSRPSKLFEGGACCGGGLAPGLSWSPDGTKIAFLGTPPGTFGSDGRLYALDPDSGHAHVLATHVPLYGLLAWQPVP